MVDIAQQAKNILYWSAPAGINALGRQLFYKIIALKYKAMLKKNEKFRNHHRGDRCFILATGPSINQQDLTLLKDEICISVSQFYLHKDYSTISPQYHCLPVATQGHKQYPHFTEKNIIAWFREMESKTGKGTLFISLQDKRLIEDNHIFHGKNINYFYSRGGWDDIGKRKLDLTRLIPSPQSVSILALTIAIYMGFKEIYLLGFDHNWNMDFSTNHFYEKNKSIIEVKSGEWKADYEYWFRINWILWHQYKIIYHYIKNKEINILNATRGGRLDVFPRVNYESLFKPT